MIAKVFVALLARNTAIGDWGSGWAVLLWCPRHHAKEPPSFSVCGTYDHSGRTLSPLALPRPLAGLCLDLILIQIFTDHRSWYIKFRLLFLLILTGPFYNSRTKMSSLDARLLLKAVTLSAAFSIEVHFPFTF